MMLKLGDEFTNGELKAEVFYNENASRSGKGHCLVEVGRTANQFLFSSSFEELQKNLKKNSWTRVKKNITAQIDIESETFNDRFVKIEVNKYYEDKNGSVFLSTEIGLCSLENGFMLKTYDDYEELLNLGQLKPFKGVITITQ